MRCAWRGHRRPQTSASREAWSISFGATVDRHGSFLWLYSHSLSRALLTPEELLGYDLRNSRASDRLRNRIGNFAATEAEFLALYPTIKAVAEDIADPGWAAGLYTLRSAREEESGIEAAMLRVLGAARFAEWKDANDEHLREIRTFAASLNLEPNTTAEVITIQRDFKARLSAIDRNRDLTPNQRDLQASTLGTETRDRLSGLLGPEN